MARQKNFSVPTEGKETEINQILWNQERSSYCPCLTALVSQRNYVANAYDMES